RSACTACGQQFEAVQPFADAPRTECPACEGRLRKLFSSVGVVFKGSGFYRTDSRASGSGASSDNGSNSGSGESSTATKDVKKDAKETSSAPSKSAPAKKEAAATAP